MKHVYAFLFLVMLLSPLIAFAQPCLGNQFYEFPETQSELDCSNRYLARRYAPMIFYFANITLSVGWYGLGDIPVNVDYDGDWVHMNNWENLDMVDALSPQLLQVPYSLNNDRRCYQFVIARFKQSIEQSGTCAFCSGFPQVLLYQTLAPSARFFKLGVQLCGAVARLGATDIF